MLSLEERHQLAIAHEAALRAARAFERPQPAGTEQPVDAVTRCMIEWDTANREFYQVLNQLTRWSEHPAVAEPPRSTRWP